MDADVEETAPLRLPRAAPIDIEFSGVSICVEVGPGGMCSRSSKGKKFLLRNLNGRFQSGELTAIMGPSGAGKTTLLNVLTGFSTKGMSGCVRALGRVNSGHGSPLRKQSCYIMQDDRLMGHLTTRESLELSAKLRLPRTFTAKERQLVIDDILESLGLAVSASVKCSCLSGGQKKRLSVALELVNNPPVIFLDEPTTGLDSSSSVQCMVLLKQLARGGRTVVMTLHQPSASLYMMLDHVYLLGKGGCCIFQGAPQNTVPYLATFGLLCPLYHSPADFMLEVVSEDQGDFTKKMSDAMLSECGVNAGENKWRKADRNIPMPTLPAARKASVVGKMWPSYQGEEELIGSLPSNDLQPVSEFEKFRILFGRALWQIHCEWSVTQVRAAFHLMVGVLLGMLFSGAGNDGGRTISNLGFLLVSLVYLSYTSMMPAVLRFPSELPVIQKEHFNNWYSLISYYASYLAAGTPVQMVHCLLFCSVAYFGSGQPNEPLRFFMYLLICELTMLRAEGLGLVLGTLVNSVNGTFLGALLTAVDIVFAGYIVLVSDMLPFFQWFSHLSYLRQGFEGAVVSVYGYNRGTLGCPEEVGNLLVEGHGVYCHFRYPSKILETFSHSDDNYWTIDVPVLCTWVLFLRIILFFTLRWRMTSG